MYVLNKKKINIFKITHAMLNSDCVMMTIYDMC